MSSWLGAPVALSATAFDAITAMAAHPNAHKTIVRPMDMMPSLGHTLLPIYAEAARILKLRALSAPFRSGDDAGVAKSADLGRREAEHFGKHDVGVFAENRRRARRLTRVDGKIQGQTRHEIAADAGLIDRGEQRILHGAAWVAAHQLAKILEVTP